MEEEEEEEDVVASLGSKLSHVSTEASAIQRCETII
jgi:hypothetical protein